MYSLFSLQEEAVAGAIPAAPEQKVVVAIRGNI
jgi:hypothetical protein